MGEKMLALVLFEDGIYYICKKTDIIQKEKACSIRYKDRRRYAGEVIAYSDKKDELVVLKTKLEEENKSDSDDNSSCENDGIAPKEASTNNNPSDCGRDEITSTVNNDGCSDSDNQSSTIVSSTRLEHTEKNNDLVALETKFEGENKSDANNNPSCEDDGIVSKEELSKENPSNCDCASTVNNDGCVDSDNRSAIASSTRLEHTEKHNIHVALKTQLEKENKYDPDDYSTCEEDRIVSQEASKENNSSDDCDRGQIASTFINDRPKPAIDAADVEGGKDPTSYDHSSSQSIEQNFATESRHAAPKGQIKIVSNQICTNSYRVVDVRDGSKNEYDTQITLSPTRPTDPHNPEPTPHDLIRMPPNRDGCESLVDLNNSDGFITLTPIDVHDVNIALNSDIAWNWSEIQLNVYEDGQLGEPDNPATDSPVHGDADIQSCSVIHGCREATTTSEKASQDAEVDHDDGDRNSEKANYSSGSSYAPSLHDSDDEIEEKTEASKRNTSASHDLDNTKTSQNMSKDLDASLLVNKVGHSAPDDVEMVVKTVEDGTKKDWCMYCDTENSKLSRHVIRKHKNEELVAQFMSFPVNDPNRKLVMDKIRKEGQFRFNTTRAINTGERKVKRRPNAKYGKKAVDFATCPSCYADYAKSSLRHHFRKCAKKNSAKQRNILQQSKQLTGRVHHKAGDVLRKKVFPTMLDDDISRAIRYDELAILFGNRLCQKYKDPHYYDMIRQKLRQLGRLLLKLKADTSNIRCLFDIYYPRNFDATIAAIQSLAGLNSSETGFRVPSIATSLGTLIKQVGKLCVTTWIKEENKEKREYAELFLEVFTNDFGTCVARTAVESQALRRRQKTVILPSQADIQKLQSFLRDNLRQNYELLRKEFSSKVWMDLAEVSLTSIQLFNRRRAGEIERIFIKDFQNHQKIDESTVGEGYANFTPEEKQAALKYVRFTIRGKLNRDVPVLLHRELLVCLNLLLKHRKDAKVHEKNQYLFGVPGKLKGDYRYLRACQLMRKFAEACGAEKPSTLRGTVLRKHVATMCVNFNLSDGEVSDLANFLGHADKIHKEHYRQPIIAREILKISKLLEVVQGGDDSEEDSENDDDEASAADTSHQVSVNNSSQIENHPESVPGPSTSTEYAEENRGGASFQNDNDSDYEDLGEPAKKKQKKKRSTSPFGRCSRVPWSATEIRVASKAFESFIKQKKLPSFHVIQKVVSDNPGIFHRSIPTIKTWVSNQIKKINKKTI